MGPDIQDHVEIDGEVYSWSISARTITVTAPDGRQKRTQVGRSPPAQVARLLGRELLRERVA